MAYQTWTWDMYPLDSLKLIIIVDMFWDIQLVKSVSMSKLNNVTRGDTGREDQGADRVQGQVLLAGVLPASHQGGGRQPDVEAGQDADWEPFVYWWVVAAAECEGDLPLNMLHVQSSEIWFTISLKNSVKTVRPQCFAAWLGPSFHLHSAFNYCLLIYMSIKFKFSIE